METLHEAMAERRREAEWNLASLSLLKPAAMVIQQVGWLPPEAFTMEQIRLYWGTMLKNGDPIQAALAVDPSGIFLARLNTQSVLSHDPLYVDDLRPFANTVAEEKWGFDIAVAMSSLAQDLASGDYSQAKARMQAMTDGTPEAVEETPDIAAAGEAFLRSYEAGVRIVPTGLAKWDAAFGGAWRKNLTLIVGRPGQGKTASILQMATGIADQGGLPLIISLEMAAEEWWARLACGYARIDYKDVLNRRLNQMQEDHLMKWHKYLMDKYSGKIRLDDRPHDTHRIWKKAAGLRPDAVFVDHLGLESDQYQKYGDNETQRLGRIAMTYKEIAKSLDLAAVIAVQMSRASEQRKEEDREPQLSDIRQSGLVEQAGDIIVGLYRDMKKTFGPRSGFTNSTWNVLKFRNGSPSIKLDWIFDGRGQRFLTQDEYQALAAKLERTNGKPVQASLGTA